MNLYKSNDKRIEVQIQWTISTHQYCCVCSSTNAITIVPEDARMQAFIEITIYIPAGDRCCQSHLIKHRFFDEDLNRLRVHSNSSSLSASEMRKIMESLSIRCDSTLYDQIGDFSLSEKQLVVSTSLTWKNIRQLRDMLTSIRDRYTRSVTQVKSNRLFPNTKKHF